MGDSELTSAYILMSLRDEPLVLGSTDLVWIANASSLCRLKHPVISQKLCKGFPIIMIVQSNMNITFIL